MYNEFVAIVGQMLRSGDVEHTWNIYQRAQITRYGQPSKFCGWSGGARPAHGMRISFVEAGPAGGRCLSVKFSNAGKMPKRASKFIEISLEFLIGFG